MAEAILGPLVGKLQELALSEAKALVAVNGDIRSLRDRLMWMQAFLRHADPRRRETSDELIRVWLKQTREVAFDAEDAIDQYFLQVDLSRYPSKTQSVINFFTGFTTQVIVRHNLSRKIEQINSRLEDIIKNKEKYKIDVASKNCAMVPWKPSANISAAAMNLDDFQPSFIKRDKEEKQLEEALSDTNHQGRLLIYVTGERGVGKATLVREVYQRPTIQTKFDDQVWASFPPYLSSSNILQMIYQQLVNADTVCPSAIINEKVEDKLKDTKYLVVIDSELNTADWNAILATLPDGHNGSRVICIMQGRFQQPQHVASEHCIELRCFESEITNDLFHQRIPKEPSSEDQKLHTELSNSGNKMAKNDKSRFDDEIFDITRGLPLAIVLLSGLLQSKEHPNEWDPVFEHLRSKKSKRLDSILTMCFDDLPHDLKSCILYFAALPVNTVTEVRGLICMWMAEGFLRPKDGKTMEKVGRMYLKELITRHLVKLVKMDSSSGEDEYVGVHHKVHEFLQLEAQEANFVEIHNGDDIPSLTNARRLSLQNYTDKYAALSKSLPKLRSILSSFQEEVDDYWEDDNDDDDEEEEEEEENQEWELANEEKDCTFCEDEEEMNDDGRHQYEGDGIEEEDVEVEQNGEGEEVEDQTCDNNLERNKEEMEDKGRQQNEGEGIEENKEEVEVEETREAEELEDQTRDNDGEEIQNERDEEEREQMKSSATLWSRLLQCWIQKPNPEERIKTYIREMLQISKFLRVINLKGVEIGEKLPAAVGNVVHLQYLGVTACSLNQIPSTVGNLRNLQTLDVRDTYVQKLPGAFWKIRTLRHVFGSGIILPKRVGDLKHLQTLETILPDEKDGWDRRTFERMVHLQSLRLGDLSDKMENAKALSEAIKRPDFLEYLETLTIIYQTNTIPLYVFTSSSQRRIRALTLDGKLDLTELSGSKFCVPNLTSLSLEDTEVSQDFINKLAKLPLLSKLTLDQNSYKDSALVFNGGANRFKSLTHLMLSDLKNLNLFEIGESALPTLSDLVILSCPEVDIKIYGKSKLLETIKSKDGELYDRITNVKIDSEGK